MALIRCYECGEKVSDSAINCPKCGFNVKRERERILLLDRDIKELERSKNTPSVGNRLFWFLLFVIPVFVIIYLANSYDKEEEADTSLTFDGVEFVWVHAGSFMMGSPSDEANRGSDETESRVTLTKGFWLSKYEVTQYEWESVIETNPSSFKGSRNPVEKVSWDDIQDYLRKKGSKYRLPTEAEWEYACRAGTSAAYSFDNSDSSLDNYAWYGNNSGDRTHPVGQKKPNAWGLYDMHGNVSEWCSDWYGDYPIDSITDPKGPSSGADRVIRGGSWATGRGNCRSAYRNYLAPNYDNINRGFRIVRNR